MMNSNFTELPQNLPVTLDDGAADHLKGKSLPKITLPSTDGGTVELASLTGRFVIYIYPMTGRPGVPLPDGWDTIPGARGCTPQSCSFRDQYKELNAFGTGVFGLSVQGTEYQREVRDRLHLPFQLLSDSSLQLKGAMHLPTFRVQGLELYKRLTVIIDTGKFEKVFYPVFRRIKMPKRFWFG
jgi:peroxiredoxin